MYLDLHVIHMKRYMMRWYDDEMIWWWDDMITRWQKRTCHFIFFSSLPTQHPELPWLWLCHWCQPGVNASPKPEALASPSIFHLKNCKPTFNLNIEGEANIRHYLQKAFNLNIYQVYLSKKLSVKIPPQLKVWNSPPTLVFWCDSVTSNL